MLLETLDVKKNDLIIYSQNLFDIKNNFKVLYKDDPLLKPHQISYDLVCKNVNEFTPKSLIVYRLLTNINDFALNRSRLGFFISINNISELIYFDPIYALKEMENYISDSSNYNLRFRIQQVGLTTLTRKNNAANYAEIYSIDLTGIEALNQNDTAFVDALLSKFSGNDTKSESIPDYANQINNISHRISEDKGFDVYNLSKMTTVSTLTPVEPEMKKSNGSQKHTFAEFLKRKAAEIDKKKTGETAQPLLDIFYDNESLESITAPKKEMNIVLKLEADN